MNSPAMRLSPNWSRWPRATPAAFVLLFALAACGGGGGGGGSPTPLVTELGAPIGTLTTQTVDAGGGTVTSADGMLSVEIPAGALSAPTDITIQPITNTIPDGDEGRTNYQLGPEGTTFAVPATLHFTVEDLDLPGIDNEMVAWQSSDGTWHSRAGVTTDAASKTVTVTTTHFSRWSLLKRIYITPNKSRVRVGKTIALQARLMGTVPPPSPPNGTDDDLLAAPRIDHTLSYVHPDSVVWGAPVGTIYSDWNGDWGHFTAPSSVPGVNPVTITVTAMIGSHKVIALASALVYSNEVWDGVADVDDAAFHYHSTFTLVQDDPDPTVLDRHFVIQSGQVTLSSKTACNYDPNSLTLDAPDLDVEVDYTNPNNPDAPLWNRPKITTVGGIKYWPGGSIVCPGGSTSAPGFAFYIVLPFTGKDALNGKLSASDLVLNNSVPNSPTGSITLTRTSN